MTGRREPLPRTHMGPLARQYEAQIMGIASVTKDVERAALVLVGRYGCALTDARQAVQQVLWTRREPPPWAPPLPAHWVHAAAVQRWTEKREAGERGAAAAMRPAVPVQTRFDAVPATPPHKRRRCDAGRDPLDDA